MSEISSPTGIVNVQWQEEKPGDEADSKRHDPPANKVAETYEENARSIIDPITILGIPVELMTNQVQAMIGGLVSETTFLKSKVKRLEKQVQAGVPPDAVVLNADAYLSALNDALRAGPPPGQVCELCLIVVNTFEDIRRSSGILAANATLADVAGHLAGSELPAQPVGLIGGPMIGALLTLAETGDAGEARDTAEPAASTADRVRQILEDRPYSVSGLEMTLSFKVAAAKVEPGQSALHAIGQIDHVLRS